MPQVQQAGDFRGNIKDYSLYEAKSGAIAVNLEVAITDIWYDGEWCPYAEHNLIAYGSIYVIKTDGKTNDVSVQSLINNAGWDGNLESIASGSWQPAPIAVKVEQHEYKGKMKYQISWVNDFDSEPGSGNVNADKAKQLQQRFGGQLRALAGNASRNQQKPSGSPSKSDPAPGPQGEGLSHEVEEKDVPF